VLPQVTGKYDKNCCKNVEEEEKKESMPGRSVVRCRLPTAVAQVGAQFRSCGICGGHSSTEAGFFRVLRFPLPLIPPALHSSSTIRGWYNRSNSQVDSVTIHAKKLKK
jgi:hypothetical protein